MTLWPAIEPINLLARGILALGGMVVFPMGLAVAARAAPVELPPGFDRFARAGRAVAWLAGIGLAIALVFPTGWRAACLALPWVLLTALASIEGAFRIREALVDRFRLEHAAIGAGFAYVVVSGAFGLAFRSGDPLFGYVGTQCLLTANHFTYAGFGAPVLAGLVGVHLREHRPLGLDYRIAAGGISVGIALVAAGILASRKLELVAAWVLAACVALLCLLLLQVARRARSRLAAVLLALSGLSGLTAAGFAVHYAMTGFAALDGAGFRRMVLFHGLVNSVGFVGLGIAGFARESSVEADS